MRKDRDLHSEEFKIRLKSDDADLVRALARKLDIPPAVLIRRWVRKEVSRLGYSVPGRAEKGSPA